MPVGRCRGADGGLQRELARGRVEEVAAADDVGDVHVEVVGDDRELVGGLAGAAEEEIPAGLAEILAALAGDAIVPGKDGGSVEAVEGESDSATLRFESRVCGESAGAGVGELGGALREAEVGGGLMVFQVCAATKAAVGVTATREGLEQAVVAVEALRLSVGGVGAAEVGAFIPVEAEPGEVGQQRGLVFGAAAGTVDVLDPQDEGAALDAGDRPAEEGRERAPCMEGARWGRGEAEASRPCLGARVQGVVPSRVGGASG